MTKKSFFERLVGATEKNSKNEYTEELNKPKETEKVKPVKKSPKQPIEKPGPSFNPEEYSSDEEGQLTIDVYQAESDIVIKSTIAGAKSENIDISISNNSITIRGIRIKDEKVSPENYYLRELYWGPFSRSIILPVDIDAEKVRASLKDGILTIKLSKLEKAKTRTIKVREIE